MRSACVLAVVSVVACGNQPAAPIISAPAAPVAPAPVAFADLVPTRTSERVVDAAPAWFAPPDPKARFSVRTSEAVAAGEPIEVVFGIVGAELGSTKVEVALVGPNTSARVPGVIVVEREPFQGCDPVHSASECDRGPRTAAARIVVGRPTAPGEYVITGRVLDGRTRVEPETRVRVVSAELAPAYRLHATGGAGPYRLRARGLVDTTVAGEPMRVFRGVYDRDGLTWIVDITSDLGERAAAFTARLPGTVVAFGERDAHVLDTGGERETSWVTYPQDGVRLVRIVGPASGDELVHYELRMHGPPAGVRPPPPKTCQADAQHCCRADGALVVPGGCQPHYRDAVQPATRRGNDGACVAIECNLKCLPADAAIATPRGPISVSTLRVGDVVWTTTTSGARIAAPLVAVRSIPLDGDHAIARITLDDGRTLRASSSHPLVDGTLVGSVVIGALVDGARVTAIESSRYRGATWDLLPAGDTGTYWADTVRLGSTLRAAPPGHAR